MNNQSKDTSASDIIIKLSNFPMILGKFYEDELQFCEEISVIEKMYLYREIQLFVPGKETGKENEAAGPLKFLLIRKTLSGGGGAFLESPGDVEFLNAVKDVLKNIGKIHIQTGEFEADFLNGEFEVTSAYDYLIMKFNPDKFNPVKEPAPAPTKLTPGLDVSDLTELSGGNPDLFREEARHGVLYGFKVDGRWVAIGGASIGSRNYDYLYVDTISGYRGRGLASSIISFSITDVLKRGKEPVYALDLENVPSIKLAERFGFEPYKKRKCLFIGKWKLKRNAEDNKAIPDSSFFA